MTYDEIKNAWNAQADEFNQWCELGEDEKVEWAARFGAATERAARQKAQEEVVSLKERIARAGVEHRRALHEALQQEREACAQVCESLIGTASMFASSRDAKTHAAAAKDCAAAIRAVLADWGACLEQLPERTVIEAHIATDRRIAAKLRKHSQGNRVAVVTRFEVQA